MPDKSPSYTTAQTAIITVAEFEALCVDDTHFLRVFPFRTESIEPGRATVRLPFDHNHVRPGPTVGGPAIMALADFAMWVAVIGAYGGAAKSAVTTSLNVNFLRPAGLADLVCEARLLKAGRRLAVGESYVHAEGTEAPVAHASLTYSVPPDVDPPKLRIT